MAAMAERHLALFLTCRTHPTRSALGTPPPLPRAPWLEENRFLGSISGWVLLHGANFLVSRHSQSLFCRGCQSPTLWKASGEKLGHTFLCKSCVLPDRGREDDDNSASNSEQSATAFNNSIGSSLLDRRSQRFRIFITSVVGDYLVGRQIGSVSFSVVWHAHLRVHGTEVAIKEITTGWLNKKLYESLMSEIFILKKINHPNIIRLHDIIEVPRKINLVLEYCRGGDLSMFIQRHGKVLEALAEHFMQQLVAGLQMFRDSNLIHRDLMPQNLLLSTNDNNSVLKIVDLGFTRSLQPQGLAETLCGSPLYMAPEIMQPQKYDAKVDLWSVGAILFQLVTGRTSLMY
ncbi:hypothetical protein ACFX2C_028595 [Malus domestica]